MGEGVSKIRLKHRYRAKNKPGTQAAGQTLCVAIPQLGKIPPFSKIAVTFEPIQQFRCPSRFRISEKCQLSLFYEAQFLTV